MKNRNIIQKTILLCLCSLLIFSIVSSNLVNFAYAVDNEPQVASNTMPNSTPDIAEYEFRPIIREFSYNLDETIPLIFEIECDSEVTALNSDSHGFVEIQGPKYSSGFISSSITLVDNAQDLKYTVYAHLANGVVLEASVYGIIVDNKLYINGNSYFGARDIYYAERYKNDGVAPENESCHFLGQEVTCIKEESFTTQSSNSKAITSGDTYINGTIQWKDDWNNWHPIQFAKVTVFDKISSSTNVELGTVYTDEDGEFNLGFDNRTGGCNIFIEVYPAGENAVVKTGAGLEYVWPSSVSYSVSTGSTTTKNVYMDMSEDIGRAFQISQAVILATKYAKTMHGSYLTSVTVKYPHNETNTGCFYKNDTVYIIGNRTTDAVMISGVILHSYASWDAIMHEYAHHIQTKLGISDNPGGWHGYTTNMYDHYMSHHGGPTAGNCLNGAGEIRCAHPSAALAKDSAIKLAYAEAWASVIGAMGQQYAIQHWNLGSNIQTVGDESYTSYKVTAKNYNTPSTSGKFKGEYCETSVGGILWDFYDDDSSTEAFDLLSLTPEQFWLVSTYNNAKTLTEFLNGFYTICSTTDYLTKIGKILSDFHVATTNPTITNASSVSQTITPVLSWSRQDNDLSLKCNSFELVVYDSIGSEVLRTPVSSASTTFTYSLTQSQWNQILYSYGQTYSVAVAAKQTDSPTTGEYISDRIVFPKPTPPDLLETISVSSINRYTEKTISLQPGQHIDYNVTFSVAGSKMIQTFGSIGTEIVIYDNNGFVCEDLDHKGHGNNAFIRAVFDANVSYTIRVSFSNDQIAGTTKLVITPTQWLIKSGSPSITSFNDIWIASSTNYSLSTSTALNNVKIMRFTAPSSGDYTFETTGSIDTYLYVVDPSSTNTLVYGQDYDDDSGEGSNARLTKTLISGKTYVVFYSAYNITSNSSIGSITLRIVKSTT